MTNAVCVIAGVPRSGTSWLGMLFDSCPVVSYRFQPWFAYAFKDRVTLDSPPEAFVRWFEALEGTADDVFLNQTDKRDDGRYPTFQKQRPAECLVVKTCRYQYLLPRLLDDFPHVKLCGIVRHPCGVIHSWLNHPREFPAGADAAREWRWGGCKNQGREEEFFGYYKWKEIAHLYLDLAQKFPRQVRVVRYESLVADPLTVTDALFDFAALPLTEQTRAFVTGCHGRHDDDPYAVYKSRDVATLWRERLPEAIQREILRDLTGTRLERFIS